MKAIAESVLSLWKNVRDLWREFGELQTQVKELSRLCALVGRLQAVVLGLQDLVVSQGKRIAELEKCPVCGQLDFGQMGEYPCKKCGVPTTWDVGTKDTTIQKE